MLFNRIKKLITRVDALEADIGYQKWAEYADTQYTSGSPLSIPANTDVKLTNNGVGGVKTYAPPGIDLYDTVTDTITGRNGEALLITLEATVVPTSGSTTFIEQWFDIGGAIGELYRRPSSFPKGQGEERKVLSTTLVYTLDTWEANGASVYVRANGTCTLHGLRYIVYRLTNVPNV